MGRAALHLIEDMPDGPFAIDQGLDTVRILENLLPAATLDPVPQDDGTADMASCRQEWQVQQAWCSELIAAFAHLKRGGEAVAYALVPAARRFWLTKRAEDGAGELKELVALVKVVLFCFAKPLDDAQEDAADNESDAGGPEIAHQQMRSDEAHAYAMQVRTSCLAVVCLVVIDFVLFRAVLA